MVIYIITAEELVKEQKMLMSLPAGDMLYILYTKDNASIPIEAYQILSSLKCKVNFTQFPEDAGLQYEFVFEMGKLCGANNNASIRSLTATNNKLIRALVNVFDKKGQAKTTRKRATSAKKADKEQEFMNVPQENPVQKTSDTVSQEAPPEKKKRTRKPKEISVQNKSEDAFDKAFDELTALFEEVKTKEFDPQSQIYGIVKAVKASISEGNTIKESFKVWFPNNYNKYVKAFEGKEDRLVSIVSNLNDEVNG